MKGKQKVTFVLFSLFFCFPFARMYLRMEGCDTLVLSHPIVCGLILQYSPVFSVFIQSCIIHLLIFFVLQGNRAAQRAAKKKLTVAKNKALLVGPNGCRAETTMTTQSDLMCNKLMRIHRTITAAEIFLSAFIPRPCPSCGELRGVGESNHYPCACGYLRIHGRRKRFFPKKRPECVGCGTMRLRDGLFRVCPCVEQGRRLCEDRGAWKYAHPPPQFIVC